MNKSLLSPDELLLRNTIREFSDRELAPRASLHDETGEFPMDNIRGLAELGLFGLTIDEKFGGAGGTMRQLTIACEEIARGCGATSVIYIAHLSLCTKFIDMFGTDAQKYEHIPPLVKADSIGAFALTEPNTGSDAAAIQTTAIKSNGHYILNGTKLFTTNALEADLFMVLATQDVTLKTRGINAILVPRNTAGFTINPQHGKMGMRASSTAELVFENSRLPAANRLGGDGEGFRETMQVLNASRIPIAAQCVGIAQAAYEASIQHVKQREAFGQPLSNFQGIQWMIADMATNIAAARLMVYNAATLKDQGEFFSTEAAMAKLFASRVAVESANKSVQIHGGVGYFTPTTVERLYRDAKVTEIYEGTSEIQRLIIARNLLDL